jgi:hypothetical protein
MRTMALLFAMLAGAQVLPVDRSVVTVKQTNASGDVVLVTIQELGRSSELQCTKGAPFCATPPAGDYWMVKLPKNHGYYDCANVDLYRKSAEELANAEIVGEYCVNEK